MDFKPYKIGKYLLLERIASGGMAEVYRAKASGAGGFEKELAVKKILPSYSSNEDFRRMFEYEARLSNKLTHANIVQIYDFVKPGDSYLLAMEFVDGKNLRQLVNKIKKIGFILPIEQSVYFINEVCKGLEYAHSKKDNITGKTLNIIHRDMSPQNIMISYEGAVKIVDFGIAKAKDRVDETRSGVIKGKFGYMSPEQANGEVVDHRSDIFSTGIILWELVTGRRLFATENDLATLKLIQECVIPVPSKINPKISQELEKIILKALTKEIRLRYQTAGLLQRSLQEYLNRHHGSYTSEDVSKVMHAVFVAEIAAEKKRFEQAHRQSIPFSQGETGHLEEEAGDSEEVVEDGDQTHSEIEVDTAVTFGDDSEKAVNHSLTGPKSSSGSSTVAKTATPTEVSDKTLVQNELSTLEGSLKLESSEKKPVTGRQEAQEMATRVAKVNLGEKSSIIKEEDTDVDKMPTLHQKTVVTGSEQDLFKSEEQETTGNVPLTGSPITNPRSITPARSASLHGPKQTNSGPNFSMGPVPQSTFELEESSDPIPQRGRDPRTRNGYHAPAKKHSSVAPFLLILLAVGGTIYLYKVLFSRDLIPFVVEKMEERKVAEKPKTSSATNEQKTGIPAGECIVRVDSDPPGALVMINNQNKGTTSLTASVPCRKDINLELKLRGHETVSENIFIKEQDSRILKSLKKIPLGGLQLSLSQNAEVYLDGVLMGQATANQDFVVEMRAGKKHRLRFRNSTLGIDSDKEVSVEEGFRNRMVLRLEENRPRKPSGNRK